MYLFTIFVSPLRLPGPWRLVHDAVRPVRHQLPRLVGAEDHEPPGGEGSEPARQPRAAPAAAHAHPRPLRLGDDRDAGVRRAQAGAGARHKVPPLPHESHRGRPGTEKKTPRTRTSLALIKLPICF